MPITSAKIGPIRSLLVGAAPNKEADLDELFGRLNPTFWGDSEEEEISFLADSQNNRIIVGMRCTARLQAHSLAGAVFFLSYTATHAKRMTLEKLGERCEIACKFLNWAVGRDWQAEFSKYGMSPAQINDTLTGSISEIPPNSVLLELTKEEKDFGKGLFLYASSFILLHELAHLENGDVATRGFWSIEAEKKADRFAMEWLLDGNDEVGRCNALLGAAVALTWITCRNIFFGKTSGQTHPQGYDRLFQTLDRGIDEGLEHESVLVWYFVSRLLSIHMRAAGYPEEMIKAPSDDFRETASYLIDLISTVERRAGMLPEQPSE